jgi:hypothetical protein
MLLINFHSLPARPFHRLRLHKQRPRSFISEGLQPLPTAPAAFKLYSQTITLLAFFQAVRRDTEGDWRVTCRAQPLLFHFRFPTVNSLKRSAVPALALPLRYKIRCALLATSFYKSVLANSALDLNINLNFTTHKDSASILNTYLDQSISWRIQLIPQRRYQSNSFAPCADNGLPRYARVAFATVTAQKTARSSIGPLTNSLARPSRTYATLQAYVTIAPFTSIHRALSLSPPVFNRQFQKNVTPTGHAPSLSAWTRC